jgi:hypothetical protein
MMKAAIDGLCAKDGWSQTHSLSCLEIELLGFPASAGTHAGLLLTDLPGRSWNDVNLPFRDAVKYQRDMPYEITFTHHYQGTSTLLQHQSGFVRHQAIIYELSVLSNVTCEHLKLGRLEQPGRS